MQAHRLIQEEHRPSSAPPLDVLNPKDAGYIDYYYR